MRAARELAAFFGVFFVVIPVLAGAFAGLATWGLMTVLPA